MNCKAYLCMLALLLYIFKLKVHFVSKKSKMSLKCIIVSLATWLPKSQGFGRPLILFKRNR